MCLQQSGSPGLPGCCFSLCLGLSAASGWRPAGRARGLSSYSASGVGGGCSPLQGCFAFPFRSSLAWDSAARMISLENAGFFGFFWNLHSSTSLFLPMASSSGRILHFVAAVLMVVSFTPRQSAALLFSGRARADGYVVGCGLHLVLLGPAAMHPLVSGASELGLEGVARTPLLARSPGLSRAVRFAGGLPALGPEGGRDNRNK